jgi:hypothetical protein
MNDEIVNEGADHNHINPQPLITQVLIIHVVDIVSSFLAAFDEREKAASVVGTLEEFLVLISPLRRGDVASIISLA